MKWYKHKQKIGLIFNCIATLILLLSMGSVGTVSAHRVHHYHYRRVSRIVKRRQTYYGALRFHKRRPRVHKSLSPNAKVKRTKNEIYHGTFYYINKDRQHYHLRRLKINHQLSRIGTERSYQLQKYFSHNMPHLNEAQYLLDHKHIKYKYCGENIADSPLGILEDEAIGSYSTPTDATASHIIYYANNGYQLAYNINDASMNHDAGDDFGHRNNILSHYYKKVGIGVSYDHHDDNYYVAVEFIG